MGTQPLFTVLFTVFDERSRCPARRQPAKPDGHLPNGMTSIHTTLRSMSCNASDSIRQTASTNSRPSAGRRSSPTTRCAPLAPAGPIGGANAAKKTVVPVRQLPAVFCLRLLPSRSHGHSIAWMVLNWSVHSRTPVQSGLSVRMTCPSLFVQYLCTDGYCCK